MSLINHFENVGISTVGADLMREAVQRIRQTLLKLYKGGGK
ncbi:hypothetical protein [Myroides odoratus]